MPTTTSAVWMSPVEVAKHLGVKIKAVWGYEAAGLLKCVAPHGRGTGKRIYFHRDDVEEFARTGICKRTRKSMEDDE